jgi:hypothetical protein
MLGRRNRTAMVAEFRRRYRKAETLPEQFDLLRAVMARMEPEDREYMEERIAQELDELIIESVRIFMDLQSVVHWS